MSIDLNNMSKDELQKLIKDAEKALKTLATRRLNEAKQAAESAAKEYGFSLDELRARAQARLQERSEIQKSRQFRTNLDAKGSQTELGERPS